MLSVMEIATRISDGFHGVPRRLAYPCLYTTGLSNHGKTYTRIFPSVLLLSEELTACSLSEVGQKFDYSASSMSEDLR